MKMLVYLYKSHLQTLIPKHHNLENHCLITPFIIRSYRTKRIITKDSSEFTISFLKNQCGLSGKTLVRACKHVNFDSSNQTPLAVVNLFRTFGFPPSSITKIIAYHPRILHCYPDKAIQPKLDFLLSILASQSELVDILTRNPNILVRSLDNHLIPFLNQLKCLTGCYPSAVAFLKRNPFVLTNNNSESSLLNIKFIRSYKTKRIITKDSSEFTISFLSNQCGLSGKTLVRASKYVNFDFANQRPLSVLNLFRTFGFPPSSITRIINYDPRILQCYPEKAIQPKLDFLLSILASQSDVVDTVTKNPRILSRSLDNHLIPFVNQLKCLAGCYSSAVAFVKRNPVVLANNNSESSLLNIKFLVKLGVPNSQILKVLTMFGCASKTPNDRFRDVVLKLMDMGFDLSSSSFLQALQTLTFIKDSTWKSRCVLLKSFGFSDQEILFMFKKMPPVMCFNEKTIIEKMEFFLNKLQWTTVRLSSNPIVLGFSLEKRTIPRCSVLQALALKNSNDERYMLYTILHWSERKFIQNFVTAYKDEVPEVVEAYEGRLKFDEYNFKQKGQLRT